MSTIVITPIHPPLSPIKNNATGKPKNEFNAPKLDMKLIDDFNLEEDFSHVSINSEKITGFKADSYKTPPRPILKISEPEPAEFAHYAAHQKRSRSENSIEQPAFNPPKITRQRL